MKASKRERKPRHKPPMTDLERAVWTLMSTDDYEVIEEDASHAVLVYIHNEPPHPLITVSVEQPGEMEAVSGS